MVMMGVCYDPTGYISTTGIMLKEYSGIELSIFVIFFLSGLMIDTMEARRAAADMPGLLIALGLIFVVAPVYAYFFSTTGFFRKETVAGLFLVTAMPTTLSSGIVMTSASGGNRIHALLITFVSNLLCIFTIPITLGYLFSNYSGMLSIMIPATKLVRTLLLIVVLPLAAGSFLKVILKASTSGRISNLLDTSTINKINQVLVIGIVWMSASLLGNHEKIFGADLVKICIAALAFHLCLIGSAFGLVYISGRGPGNRESIIFLGSQKTLPLSVALQSTLFPGFGNTLVFCISHHFLSLFFDGFLVSWLAEAGTQTKELRKTP